MKFVVGFHEWAWSRRTEGFPIFAVTPTEIVKVGVTEKGATIYEVPDETIVIARSYSSNNGYIELLFYKIENEKPKEVAVVEEKENFKIKEIEKLTSQEKEAIKRFLDYFFSSS